MRYIKLHDETATSADVHAELVAAFHFTVSHSRVQKMARVAYVGLEAERAKLARHGGAKGKRRAPTPPETAHPPTASRSEGSVIHCSGSAATTRPACRARVTPPTQAVTPSTARS